jgi:hypothetical protein
MKNINTTASGISIKKFNKSDMRPSVVSKEVFEQMVSMPSLNFALDGFGEFLFNKDDQMSIISGYINKYEVYFNSNELNKLMKLDDNIDEKNLMSAIFPVELEKLIEYKLKTQKNK